MEEQYKSWKIKQKKKKNIIREKEQKQVQNVKKEKITKLDKIKKKSVI